MTVAPDGWSPPRKRDRIRLTGRLVTLPGADRSGAYHLPTIPAPAVWRLRGRWAPLDWGVGGGCVRAGVLPLRLRGAHLALRLVGDSPRLPLRLRYACGFGMPAGGVGPARLGRWSVGMCGLLFCLYVFTGPTPPSGLR